MEITKVSTEPAEPPIGWADALGQDAENPPAARTHGRQLFEPDGTTHTVSTCENRIKAQFELWVQNNALRAVSRAEGSGDVDMADKLMSAYTGDSGAGYYTWDGRHVRRALTDIPGLSHLLYLLMVRCDPKKTEEDAMRLVKEYPAQVGQLIRWALGNSPTPAAKSTTGEKLNGTVGNT